MRTYLTEFTGTFLLTLVVILSANHDSAPLIAGATLALLVYAGGYISGAHYNSAVSVSAALSKGLSSDHLKKYIVFQIFAAFCASIVGYLFTGSVFHAGTNTIFFAPLLAEILATFLLCYVVLHTTVAKETKNNQYFGLAIGSALFIAIIMSSMYSGAIINPAIAIGSFLASFFLGSTATVSSLLLGIVGPLTGAFFAASIFGMQRK